jgi:nicotinamide mononucleotide transporter
MDIYNWISNNYIEIFGAATGILYVFLEIKQNLWLWPVGIITSAVYIWVFFTGKLYADTSLQVYYLVISVLGWYWWLRGKRGRVGEGEMGGVGATERQRVQGSTSPLEGTGQRAQGNNSPFEDRSVAEIPLRRKPVPTEGREGGGDVNRNQMPVKLIVHRINLKSGIILTIVFVLLYFVMWLVLDRLTDSPVPACDSFITSLSIVATWMLARKIFEHWYLWIVVNAFAAGLFLMRGLYPTLILYIVYCAMSFAGLIEWRKSLTKT